MSQVSYLDRVLAASSTLRKWEDAVKTLENYITIVKRKKNFIIVYNQSKRTLIYRNSESGERGVVKFTPSPDGVGGITIDVETYSAVLDQDVVCRTSISFDDTIITASMSVGAMLTQIEQMSIFRQYELHPETYPASLPRSKCGTGFVRVILRMLIGKVYFDNYRYDLK